MDKIVLSLFLVLTLSTIVCHGRPPWRRHHNRETKTTRDYPSVLRLIGLYANPFGWIGRPTWPQRTKNNRKTDPGGYRWVIEIDGK